jgi:hypothetical protein
MSGSTLVDDLGAAEGALRQAVSALSRLVEGVFAHRPTVLRLDPGQPLWEAIEQATGVIEASAAYCRGACSFLPGGTCQSGGPEHCDCPCRHRLDGDPDGSSPEPEYRT